MNEIEWYANKHFLISESYKKCPIMPPIFNLWWLYNLFLLSLIYLHELYYYSLLYLIFIIHEDIKSYFVLTAYHFILKIEFSYNKMIGQIIINMAAILLFKVNKL